MISQPQGAKNTVSGNRAARVAMVFAHPAHEVFTAGMIQRLRPDVLYLTCGSTAGDPRREQQSREVLSDLGHSGRVTFLPFGEDEVFAALLAVDVAFFERLGQRVAEWLTSMRPTTVFTDAYEWYNPVHDTAPLLVDVACRKMLPPSRRPQQCELPFGFQTLQGCLADKHMSPDWSWHRFRLTAAEAQRKREVIRRCETEDPKVLEVTANWPDERFEQEVFYLAAHNRDFGQAPPHGGWATYDDHGARRVQNGRYARSIRFRDHYAPVARALGATSLHNSLAQSA